MSNFSTFGKDVPMGHPDMNGDAAIFVPAADAESELPDKINNGAGIVGFGNSDGTLTIYFESNRFSDPQLHKWEDKLRMAYKRMVAHLPTVSHMIINSEYMEQVGLMDSKNIDLFRPNGLKRWLAHTHTTDSHTF